MGHAVERAFVDQGNSSTALVVAAAHRIHPDAGKLERADCKFVVLPTRWATKLSLACLMPYRLVAVVVHRPK